MTVGYSGTPLAKKLGIKEGHLVVAIQAPDHLASILDPLPPGVQLRPIERASATGLAKEVDVALLFCRDRSILERELEEAGELITWSGGLWVCWPKKSSPLASDLSDGVVRSEGLSTGLVDNKVCAVDGDWSGLRFVHRKENRPTAGKRG